MRLICPACETAYEIPDRAIAVEGREVQCSVCAHAWYQLPPSSAVPPGPLVADVPPPDLADRLRRTLRRAQTATPVPSSGEDEATEPEAAAPPDPTLAWKRPSAPEKETAAGPEAPAEAPTRTPANDALEEDEPADLGAGAGWSEPEAEDGPSQPAFEPFPPPRRRIDPAVLEVLRAEAQHETQQRRRESAEPLETQPDLGLDPPPRKPRPTAESIRDRLARLQAAERAAGARPAGRWQPGEEGQERRRDPEAPRMRVVPTPNTAPPEQPATAPATAPHTPAPSRALTRSRGDNLPVPMSSRELAVIEAQRERAGFRIGFGLTAGLGAAVLALFLMAPLVLDRMPAAAPVLDRVIAGGEAMQTRLAEGMRGSIEALTDPDG